MSRTRLLLFWMVLAAIPMQGFAVVSMLFCAAATHEHKVPSTQGAASERHLHATHTHAGDPAVEKAAHGPTDATHDCGVCASCCSGVAMTGCASLFAVGPAHRAELTDPFVLIRGPRSAVPDKPPRA